MYNLYKNKVLLIIITLVSFVSISVQADSHSQARKLYQSLTGTTPSQEELKIISKKIDDGQALDAAKDIIDSKNGIDSRGNFYNVTVKNFSTPWSNLDYTKMFPLNDLTATVIGWVRDEKQFNQILYTDSVYVANGLKMAGGLVGESTNNSAHLIYNASSRTCDGVSECTFCNKPSVIKGRILFIDPSIPNSTKKICRFTKMSEADFRDGSRNDNYYIPHLDAKLSTSIIKSSNAQYEEMELQNLDLSDKRLLVEKTQVVRLHQDPQAISGLLTTRAWGSANYSAGTNRRSFQSSMKSLFCKDMMDINDTNTPDDKVHRDVDRKPGGAATTYKTLCVGCHSVMDPHVGAYAYYNFPFGAIEYTQGAVVSKMNHNAIFPEGYITQDDSWVNFSTQGQNASFGWGKQESGNGLATLGQMYSETKEFHRCMAKTVFKTVCYKDATSADEKSIVKGLAMAYEEDNFNMKNLFLKTSVACMGK